MEADQLAGDSSNHFRPSYLDSPTIPKRRGRPPRSEASYSQKYHRRQLVELQERHRQAIRLRALGFTSAEIARQLGVSHAAVSVWIGSEIVQQQISIMSGAMDAETIDIGMEIKNFAPKALELLKQVVEGDGEIGKAASVPLRVKTADKWLDRAGFVAPKVIHADHLHGHFSQEDIEEIKRRGRELIAMRQVAAEDIVEAEVLSGAN